jgi:hypothetical protein
VIRNLTCISQPITSAHERSEKNVESCFYTMMKLTASMTSKKGLVRHTGRIYVRRATKRLIPEGRHCFYCMQIPQKASRHTAVDYRRTFALYQPTSVHSRELETGYPGVSK